MQIFLFFSSISGGLFNNLPKIGCLLQVMYVCMYVCMYVFIYLFIYVFTYLQIFLFRLRKLNIIQRLLGIFIRHIAALRSSFYVYLDGYTTFLLFYINSGDYMTLFLIFKLIFLRYAPWLFTFVHHGIRFANSLLRLIFMSNI